MRSISLALSCILPCLAQQRSLDFAGQVFGSLKGEDGTAIAGGSVSLALLPPHAKRMAQTMWSAVTGAGGTFQFARLAEGRYSLCADLPRSTWLNPCQWGPQPVVVAVSAAQPVANVAIVMKRGAAVRVRVDDPNPLLSQHDGKTAGAHLLLGVGSDAHVFPDFNGNSP